MADQISDGRPRLLTIKQFVVDTRYSMFSEATVRHLIFNARPRLDSKGRRIPTNGLEGAVVKIGRRVLIDPVEFEAWIDRQRLSQTEELSDE